MFKLSLFRIRTFSAGIFAGFLASVARGGVMIMLSILLQGIWLPLHGINYTDTPFWAGVYLLPLSAGFVTMGPISGTLSDKYGARGLASLGMIIVCGTFLGLATLPHSFSYLEFAALIYVQGMGMGMFASPRLHWFPTAIANPFMSSLHDAFYVSAGLSGVAAVASLLRGKRYIHGQPQTKT